MIDPIDILKSDCAEAFAENDRLRALNAELLGALKALHILLDFAEPASDDKPMMFDDYGPLNQAFEKALQAIAKASADDGAVSE